MVVIIDDREDVWNFAPNLIHVRPYHFFQHTGDINAPPGLSKQEKDDKEGFDFTSLNSEEKPKVPPTESNGSESKYCEDDEQKALQNSNLNDINDSDEVKADIGEEIIGNKSAVKTLPVSHVAKEESQVTNDDESKPTEVLLSSPTESEVKTEETVKQDLPEETKKTLGENVNESGKKPTQEEEDIPEAKKIHVHDTDDYLLHLQDILRTIHHAYYELYDDNRKQRDESKAVPDMKIVLPYVRRKVLEKVNIVFSGVVPTNTPLEKSKPYLVAKSLGAVIMDRVTEITTHVIAARLGTAKVMLH